MVVELIDRYYGDAPLEHAEARDVSGFTVFVGPPDGWTFSARPRPDRTREYDAAAVSALVSGMTGLGLDPALEWVHERTPSLLDAVLSEGTLTVEETPLMILGDRRPGPEPAGVPVRMIGTSDDDALASSAAVARVAFDPAAPADAGPEARDAVRRPPTPQALALLRSERARTAVAEHPVHGVVAGGRHIAVGDVTEIVAVATLPAFRRTGLAAAVTRRLVDDALERGCTTVFLTASSPAVATLYQGLGFTRIATGYAAS